MWVLWLYSYKVKLVCNTYARQDIGQTLVFTLKKSDIKKFYNYLADERYLKS